MRNYIRREIIEPEIQRTGEVLFTQAQVVYMAFIRKYGANGSSIGRGDLRSLVNLIEQELKVAKVEDLS